MATLGHIEIVVQDSTGVAVNAATVKVRRQGAWSSTTHDGTDTTLFVRGPGAITVNDIINVEEDSGTNATVTGITSRTSITVSAGLGISIAAYDRFTIVTSTAAGGGNFTFKDPDGSAATANSNEMTTDANGYAQCYAKAGFYDLLASGGTPTITTRLIADVPCLGESYQSNVYSVGSAQTAFLWDTLRNMAQSGDKLFSFRTNNGATELFYATYTGAVWKVISNAALVVGGGLYIDSSGVDGTPGAAGTITAEGFITTAQEVRVGTPSAAGTAGRMTLTNVTTTAVSTGTATIKTETSSNINSTGWLKIFDGTTERFVPLFNARG